MAQSKMEERLDDTEPQKPQADGKTKLISTLSKVLDDRDQELANDVMRSRAQVIIAENLRKARMLGGAGTTETGEAVQHLEGQAPTRADGVAQIGRDIASNATMLAKEGVPPNIVAEFVRSSMAAISGGVGMSGPMGAGDVASLITAISGALGRGNNGTDSETKELLKELIKSQKSQGDSEMREILRTLVEDRKRETDAHMKALAESNALLAKRLTDGGGTGGAPKGFVMIEQADGKWKMIPSADGQVDVIARPRDSGVNVDELHEKNRHDEELERVKNEKEYHASIASSVADAAGALVAFAGEKFAGALDKESEPASPKKQEVALQVFECGKCKTNFTIVPGTVRFNCPKCGELYSSVRGEWVENQPATQGAESPADNSEASTPPQEDNENG